MSLRTLQSGTSKALQPSMFATLPGVQDSGELVPLEVEVTRIKAYERNPRRCENPEYDRIKASIRARGMDFPLVITCRPGETSYVVHAGGNTRLRILKQLHEETGEARFYRIHCLLRPWTRESDVLVAHLCENELRGHLTLIDKARAVIEARALISEELGQRISNRRLEAELRKAGYSVSHSRISHMEYAVKTLWPLIPRALEAGLGWRQTVRIRSLERAAGHLWLQHCPASKDEFGMLFASLCQRYDGPDWDIDELHRALEFEIAQEAEYSIQVVRAALDARINGTVFETPEPGPVPEPLEHDPGSGGTKRAAHSSGAQGDGNGLAEHPPDRPDGSSGADLSNGSRDLPYELANEAVSTAAGRPDLRTLRNRACTLAQHLAHRHGIGNLIVPLADRGLGFMLRDVPHPDPAEPLDECLQEPATCMLWWQLAACSEMTAAPAGALLPELVPGSVLHKALEARDTAMLAERVPVPDPGHAGDHLWRRLHEQDWNHLIRLMDTYRRIRLLAAECGEAIWEEAP